MATRIITGLILAPLVTAGVVLSPEWVGFILIVLASGLCAWEYLAMSTVREVKPLVAILTAWTMLGPAITGLVPQYFYLYWGISPVLVLSLFLFVPSRIPSAFQESASAGFVLFYVGLLLSLTARMARVPEHGAVALMTLFAVAWGGDTLAFFGGKFLGKRKLYEAVSPKKTWMGSWFGLGGSVLGVSLVKLAMGSPIDWTWTVAIGLVGGALEQVGDLAESLLKRSSGVKDSGSILPGHGGMLDRVDGLLFATPVVYVAYYFERLL